MATHKDPELRPADDSVAGGLPEIHGKLSEALVALKEASEALDDAGCQVAASQAHKVHEALVPYTRSQTFPEVSRLLEDIRGEKAREDRVQKALYALELERRQTHGIGRLLLGGAQRVLLRQVKNRTRAH